MNAASDDLLTRPLGLDRPAPGRLARFRSAINPAPIMAAAAVVIGAALGVFVAFVHDPLGGQPHAIVTIEMRAAAPPGTERTPGAAEPSPRSSADDVESASGVSVVRAGGGTAPGSVVIRVPDPLPVTLAPAPDKRLIERGRHGNLPKVSEDGARPLDVYARPSADALPDGRPPSARIAIVVTGLGISQSATAEAIAKLPAPVTLAFAPYGGELDRTVGRAREAGHEVMLQIPMEPFDYPDNDPGPHTLLAGPKASGNADHMAWVMSRFSGYVGVVNYMGGKLTADEAALAPVLREIAARGLGYLDDGSSPRSLVPTLGPKARAPVARADGLLDAQPRADAIDRELSRLEEQARKGGFALGTASALPLSIDRITRWAQGLQDKGILLVPASRALRAPR